MTQSQRRPHRLVTPNTAAFLTEAMIAPTGFREYDARWRYPEQINLPGVQALGLGLATQLRELGLPPRIVVGADYRSYSLPVKQALMLGLIEGGAHVLDIGLALSPMAYFAQFDLDCAAVAMVTASHNPNGWTGVKIGCDRPLTHGPDEMARLRDLVLEGGGAPASGGGLERVLGVRERYLDDLVGDFRLSRPLKVVCATGNGTAGAFAPELLSRLGAEVVPLLNELDYDFPVYNANPEAMEMLEDMASAVRDSGADLAMGFDGDGDRCGVVDNEGVEIFADKMGVILAKDLIKKHPGACFVADVKSTGLYLSDPELAASGARIDYWKTGHSHMKRRVKALGALAGFEKSGHYFLAEPIGRGYDDGLRAAVAFCKLLDDNPTAQLSDLRKALPTTYLTPTMSPACADEEKYGVVDALTEALKAKAAAGGALGGEKITDIVTVNGARAVLADGGFALVRASSNTPNLVVVCESPKSEAAMKAIFEDLDALIRAHPQVGAYDQRV